MKVLGYMDAFSCITVVVSSAFCELAAGEHLFIGNEYSKSCSTLYL